VRRKGWKKTPRTFEKRVGPESIRRAKRKASTGGILGWGHSVREKRETSPRSHGAIVRFGRDGSEAIQYGQGKSSARNAKRQAGKKGSESQKKENSRFNG